MNRKRALVFGLLGIGFVFTAGFTYRAVQRVRLRRPLIEAIQRNDTKTALALLDAGADPNARDIPAPTFTWRDMLEAVLHPHSSSSGDAATALQVAVLYGDIKISRSLVAHGAEVNAVSGFWLDFTDHWPISTARIGQWPNGYTALMDAAAIHRIDLVQLLLDCGANPNLRPTEEPTALMLALNDTTIATTNAIAMSNRPDIDGIIRLLLAHSADPRLVGPSGETAVQIAISSAWTSVLPLLEHGADVNTHDPQTKQTLLMEACAFEDLKTIRFLAAHGADINAINNEGRTAIVELCHRYGGGENEDWIEGVKVLQAAGATPNIQDKQGMTALMEAAGVGKKSDMGLGGNVEAIKLLLAHGADPTIKDKSGLTALQKLPPVHPGDEYGLQVKQALEQAIARPHLP